MGISELSMMYSLSILTCMNSFLYGFVVSKVEPLAVCIYKRLPFLIALMPSHTSMPTFAICVGSTILPILFASAFAKIVFAIIKSIAAAVISEFFVGRNPEDEPVHEKRRSLAVNRNPADGIVRFRKSVPMRLPAILVKYVKGVLVYDCELALRKRYQSCPIWSNSANDFTFNKEPLPAFSATNGLRGLSITAFALIDLARASRFFKHTQSQYIANVGGGF